MNSMVNRSGGDDVRRGGPVFEVEAEGRTVQVVPPRRGPAAPDAPPSALLDGRSTVIGHQERRDLLDRLLEWANGTDAFGALVVSGRSGSGKTRLATELACRVLDAQGDTERPVGFVTLEPQTDARVLAAAPPRLVVVDDAENHPDQVEDLLASLPPTASPERPVRVVLITRRPAPSGTGARRRRRAPLRTSSGDANRAIGRLPVVEMEGAALRPSERVGLFLAAHQAFSDAGDVPHAAGEGAAPLVPDLSGSLFEQPLLVVVAAFLTARDEGPLPVTESGLLNAVLEHEERHWRSTWQRFGAASVAEPPLRRLAALATLTGAEDEKEALDLLQRLTPCAQRTMAERAALERWLTHLADGLPTRWPQPVPDRLGEHLVLTELRWEHPTLDAVLHVGRTPDLLSRPMQLLTRIVTDPTDRTKARPLTEHVERRLNERLRAYVDLAVQQYEDSRGGQVVNAPLAGALADLCAAVPPAAGEVAEAFEVLEKHEGEALALGTEIGNQLLESVRPVVAESGDRLLHVLAELVHKVGLWHTAFEDGPRGLALVQEATELYRSLARTDHASYAPQLAHALYTLAEAHAVAGDTAAALVCSQEVVDVYRELAPTKPERFTGYLANALNTLSNRYVETGDRTRAVSANREAVDLYRGLVRVDPARYSDALATVLSNLAVKYAEMGDTAAARPLAQEAAELMHELAEADPAEHGDSYAVQLGYLSEQYARAGDSTRAVALAQEAADLCRAMAQADPAGHTPDLAVALHFLATRHLEASQFSPGLAVARESQELLDDLERRSPGDYGAMAERGRTLLAVLDRLVPADGQGSDRGSATSD